MFLNGISMYYCFRCPLPSFVVIACHSLLVHQFASPISSIYHPLWVKVTGIIFLWGCMSNRCAVWAHISHHTTSCRRVYAGGLIPFLFHSIDIFVQTLNFCCCDATVSIDIARLADNSAGGPPFATAYVVVTAMLSRYPLSESRI